MSEPVELSRLSDIRQGDLIRIERRADAVNPARAVEYFARTACDLPPGWHATFIEGTDPSRRVLLLDRPVVLPTRPYSLVVPPPECNKENFTFILEPMGESVDWWSGGNVMTEHEVRAAVKRGWRIIEGPEETTNGDTE